MGNFLSKAKTATSAASEKMSGPAAFKHYSKAQSTFKPPLIANENAYLGDIYSRSVSNLGLHPNLLSHNRVANICARALGFIVITSTKRSLSAVDSTDSKQALHSSTHTHIMK